MYRFHMDFDRLRYLAAVARTGSVRGAAAALQVSPGAVSKAIARLEQESGTELVVPQGRGIALTDDGAWLAQRAEFLVAEHASLGQDLSARNGRAGDMCVATYDVFATWFLSVLTRSYLPDIALSLRERWPGEIEAAVSECVSDVGITWMPVATEGVEHVEAARVALGVYAAPRVFADTPTPKLPFAIPIHPVSGAARQFGPLDGWPADGPSRDARYRASSLEARLELARAGQAAVLLPTFVADRHNAFVRATHRLEARPLPRSVGSLRRTVYVVRRTNAAPFAMQRTEIVRQALAAVCKA
jgi:DNA-binding transcriptional LysR family regulator